jgi:hypothetical protein
MKNKWIVRILSVLILATLAAASAQAQSDHSLVARIPFTFWVQGERFPAGDYIVDPLQHGYLTLRASRSGSVILRVLPNYSRPNDGPKGKLIFNRYGNHYFLREAWIPTCDFGMDFMPSKVEAEMAKQSEPQQQMVALERH